MPIHLDNFSIKTVNREGIVDITQQVQKIVTQAIGSGISEGVCRIFIPHTTAGLTVNENADPDVKKDLINIMKRNVPSSSTYLHIEGNSDAHMKSSLMGSNLELLLHKEKLILGKWQGIMLCEFDGPRIRTVYVQIQGE